MFSILQYKDKSINLNIHNFEALTNEIAEKFRYIKKYRYNR